jgi:hypothetical protein
MKKDNRGHRKLKSKIDRRRQNKQNYLFSKKNTEIEQ